VTADLFQIDMISAIVKSKQAFTVVQTFNSRTYCKVRWLVLSLETSAHVKQDG